jgi:phage shock protein C
MVAKKVKKLTRPKKGRKLAGVCLGIANYLEVDPTVIRIIWIFLLIPGGIPGILLYLLCWLVIPSK